MCSFELLVMDGKPVVKHVERFTEISKLSNVASCWLYFGNILAMLGPMKVRCNICSGYVQKLYTTLCKPGGVSSELG